ncbi:MAG TPA: hypothetical protein VFA20_35520 [Myxococcaceae bacterium]|nr:hypothetical protein [Myxococcaceae bacterium]
MYRGASDGIEDYIYAPPDGDCENARGVFRIDWNSKQNVVKYQLKYKKIPPHPSIHRTEGVDFFPNPAHLAPKDFDNGGYRFWTILAAQSFLNDFYYSATTLDFVGSQYDFPAGQPPGTIKVQIPVFGLLTNHLMFPEEDGSLFREWTMPYDKVEVEGGPWSLGIATYIPLTLCEGNEFQPISGQLRPWAGPWLTHDQLNMSWGDMLKRAPVFDTTVDENQAFPDFFGYEPYIYSAVAFMGNQPAFQGGIPKGWRNNLASVIQQVAPGIRQLEGGGAGPGCTPFVLDPHIHGPNRCAP